MREIKFRGKRTNNGEWAFGDYGQFHKRGGDWEHEIHCPIPKMSGSFWSEVIPETVGQFTGIHDKNGVEIYEGDVVILTYERWRQYSVEYWGEGFGSFVLVKDGKYFESFFDYSVLEVIGTIHDKLKGELQ